MTLFGRVGQLPVGVKKVDKSWTPAFLQLIFQKINERRYAALYSRVESRPNFWVNIWVGLEIIKGMFDYTNQELLFHNGKMRIRGLEKVRNSVILMTIGINFGRLWAYFLEGDPVPALFLTFAVLLLAFLAKSLAEKSTGSDFDVA